MGELDKSQDQKFLAAYAHSESPEITKAKLELAKGQDERAFQYSTTEQKERHLQRTREWCFLYFIIFLMVIICSLIVWETGEKYLKDMVELLIGFISGFGIGKYKSKN